MRDLYSNLSVEGLLVPQVITGDQASSGLDLQGSGSGGLVFYVGASGDTLSGSDYIELEVEESEDGSTWTDVADADLTNTVTGTNTGTVAKVDASGDASKLYFVGYKGSKQHIRGQWNTTGTHTNGTPGAIYGVRGHPNYGPVTHD